MPFVIKKDRFILRNSIFTIDLLALIKTSFNYDK